MTNRRYDNIRIYRSSLAQLEYFRTNKPKLARFSSQLSLPTCDSHTNQPKSSLRKFSSQFSLYSEPNALKNKNRGLSLVNLNELVEFGHELEEKRVNRVMAHGFPWTVEKSDILEFFKGIKIMGGDKGVRIEKNITVEAYVDVATAVDHDNALSRNGRVFESQIILGRLMKFEEKKCERRSGEVDLLGFKYCF